MSSDQAVNYHGSRYNPEPLSHGYYSASYLTTLWTKYNGTDREGYLRTLFEQYGITNPNSTEISSGLSLKKDPFEMHLGQSLSRRALVKWTTGGHTGVGELSCLKLVSQESSLTYILLFSTSDVNLIAYGKNHERMVGNHDNTGEDIITFPEINTNGHLLSHLNRGRIIHRRSTRTRPPGCRQKA